MSPQPTAIDPVPDEMAPVVAFLASDDASYMTGATIIVGGGFVLRHSGMQTGAEGGECAGDLTRCHRSDGRRARCRRIG